jgi:hypothetical protein
MPKIINKNTLYLSGKIYIKNNRKDYMKYACE